ncbi:Uncharacterised protein [Listeria newyorkensis]|nr:Uncharacterised protein [Listeria newyorkensis]
MIERINDFFYVLIVIACLMLVNFKNEKWKSFWGVLFTFWLLITVSVVIFL